MPRMTLQWTITSRVRRPTAFQARTADGGVARIYLAPGPNGKPCWVWSVVRAGLVAESYESTSLEAARLAEEALSGSLDPIV